MAVELDLMAEEGKRTVHESVQPMDMLSEGSKRPLRVVFDDEDNFVVEAANNDTKLSQNEIATL